MLQTPASKNDDKILTSDFEYLRFTLFFLIYSYICSLPQMSSHYRKESKIKYGPII